MTIQKEVGEKGERVALTFLKEKGYSILEQNWRKHPAELDIIARDGHTLVFVEVKARTDKGFKIEKWGLDHEKLRILSDASYAFMEEYEWEGEFRFDIITITFDTSGKYEIDHFPDAFFPGLEGF